MTIDDTVADFYNKSITYQDYRKQLQYYKKEKEKIGLKDFHIALKKAKEREQAYQNKYGNGV